MPERINTTALRKIRQQLDTDCARRDTATLCGNVHTIEHILRSLQSSTDANACRRGIADQFMLAVMAVKCAHYGNANPRNSTDIAAICTVVCMHVKVHTIRQD